MAYVTNASEIAYSFVKEQIDSGYWKPGDRIWTEVRLCEHLGVSRVAIRQAIVKLVAVSMLYKMQGSGTYVCAKDQSDVMAMGLADVQEEDLLDILEFRRYFECGNIIMFVQNADSEDVRALEESYQDMIEAANSKLWKHFAAADCHFHNIIARGTKKAFIFHISAALNSVLLKHHVKLNARIGPEIGLEYHAHILYHVKKRDADLAAIYIQRHIDATIEAMKSVVSKHSSHKKQQKAGSRHEQV